MKFGIMTPVVSLVPGAHARWELDGTIDDVRRVAEAADRLGFEYLTCSEHMAVPFGGMDLPGPRYWDPYSTLGYLAACTSWIRLTTSVLVLGYHHPLEIIKRGGTLDRMCNGRLILGVGAGYLEREFELLGAPFEDRGERADDAIRAVRASFARRTPAYAGPYYQFDDIVVDPCGVQEHAAHLDRRADPSVAASRRRVGRWMVPVRGVTAPGCGLARTGGRDGGLAGADEPARGDSHQQGPRRPDADGG